MIRRFSHQIRTTSEWSARGWHERWSAPRSESSTKGSLIVTVAYIPQQSRQQAKPALDLGDRVHVRRWQRGEESDVIIAHSPPFVSSLAPLHPWY